MRLSGDATNFFIKRLRKGKPECAQHDPFLYIYAKYNLDLSVERCDNGDLCYSAQLAGILHSCALIKGELLE
jgi:hypothetical protein